MAKPFMNPSELRNPDKLGTKQIQAIIQDLRSIRDADAALANNLIKYVVCGEPEDAVLKLGSVPDAARVIGLMGAAWEPGWDRKSENRLNVLQPGTPPPALIRLGHVYDAALRSVGQARTVPNGWPGWLAALIAEITFRFRPPVPDVKWSLNELESLLKAGDLPPDLLARVLLDRDALPQLSHFAINWTGAVKEGGEYFGRHLQTVRSVLQEADAARKCFALGALEAVKFDPLLLADDIVELATGSSKTVREAALSLLSGAGETVRPAIAKVLQEGDVGQRNEAVQLLWRLYGPAADSLLREHAAAETSDRVRQTIDKLTAASRLHSGATPADLTLPPLQIELGEVPLSDIGRQGLNDYLDRVVRQEQQNYERQLEQFQKPDRPKWLRKPDLPKPLDEKDRAAWFDFIEGKNSKLPEGQNRPYMAVNLGDWAAPPDLKLIHFLRLQQIARMLHVYDKTHDWLHFETRDLEAYRTRCQPPFGLRELDAAAATLPHGRPGLMVLHYLRIDPQYGSFCDWEPDAIWPAFIENPDLLKEAVTGSSSRSGGVGHYDYLAPVRRRNAYRVLSKFPRLPEEFIPILWDVALGEGKNERPLAQAALATVPDKTSNVLVALQDGRQTIRGAAAEWLGKLGDAAAIESLKAAFRKEKQELVKGQLMQALELLGADVAEFLDRKKLLKEAEAGSARKRPKGMEWVPLDSLPALHWGDSGQAVDRGVVQWWVVQAVQQKLPACGPLVRRYLAMCEPKETAALAKFLLSTWIAHDTRTLSHEEASARATQEADQMWSQHGQQGWFAQYYKSRDNYYHMLFQKYSTDCVSSAIGEKGLLALVAPGADRECIRLADQYIRKFFGTRLAQSKALLGVLAWIKDPLAIQVLLSIANRFRTKALRKLAEEFVQALADREGWTIDELADRTIPDAGFARSVDANGEPLGTLAKLVLDYGPRQFTVTLDDDLQPVIATAEGKTVKSLPAPAKSDDEEKAKAAKKAFSEAKNTVKEVVKLQSERLYEAMCTQRSWPLEDWKRYLADHPVVGRLCTRAAWSAFEEHNGEERFAGCFRPLEDGSLTNAADEEVRLGPNTRVLLAHAANTPDELEPSWLKHFQDYDVSPFFPQFGRPVYRLSDAAKQGNVINEFEGHGLSTFQLRGKATKLGYLRGDAEDGGSFYLYRKPFPSLGLQAVIEFTGSFVPEQDMPAAITNFYFTAMKGNQESVSTWRPAVVPLEKGPSVLLSECYNDVRQIAAEGTGFDPEWKKKSFL